MCSWCLGYSPWELATHASQEMQMGHVTLGEKLANIQRWDTFEEGLEES